MLFTYICNIYRYIKGEQLLKPRDLNSNQGHFNGLGWGRGRAPSLTCIATTNPTPIHLESYESHVTFLKGAKKNLQQRQETFPAVAVQLLCSVVLLVCTICLSEVGSSSFLPVYLYIPSPPLPSGSHFFISGIL